MEFHLNKKPPMHDAHTKHSQTGMTLIELMAVVVIVGILSAIALPSYSQFIQKSRRSAAKTTLLQMYARQENHFANAKIYANSGLQLGYPAETFVVSSEGDPSALTGTDSVYSIAINRTSNFEYSITATAIGKQVKDTHCTTYTINNASTRGATNSDCW